MTQNQEHTHHITPIKVYVGTFIALTVLMLLTVGVVYFPFHSSWANNGINLTIAVIKATLVVAIFMGVRNTSNLAKMFALAGFVWLSLMGIIFGDYMTRGFEPVRGWYANDRVVEKGGTAEPELESTARSRTAKEYSNKIYPNNSGASANPPE